VAGGTVAAGVWTHLLAGAVFLRVFISGTSNLKDCKAPDSKQTQHRAPRRWVYRDSLVRAAKCCVNATSAVPNCRAGGTVPCRSAISVRR
jgi:hypothetical protein